MLRFAPSPTGDMHIGDLRVALFNYIIAKQRNEELVVRMEESENAPIIEGKDKEFLDILGLFGVDYSNVIYQSENLRYHRMMAIQLIHAKKAFSCFCTPAELEVKRAVAKKANKPFVYDDTCSHLRADMVIDNENPFTIRLKRPEAAVVIKDLIQGELSFTPDEIDAFVIMRAEKYPTDNFACAVDDMISDISLVIRSEEHLSDTPKQIAVRNALGYDKEMAYAHLPVILNEQGEKLSENDAHSSVKWLLEEGFLPSAIINYLLQLGNTTPEEIFSLEDALEWLDLSTLSTSSERFDLEKLKSINSQHLHNLDDKELSRYVGFADEAMGKVAKIYLNEASTLKELRPKIEAIFAAKVIPDTLVDQAAIMKKVIIAAPYIESFDAFNAYIAKESGLEGEVFTKTLSLLVTGSENGPDVAKLYVYLKDFLGEIVK